MPVEFSNTLLVACALDISLSSITMRPMSDATRILDRVQQGDPQAAEELLPSFMRSYANSRRTAWPAKRLATHFSPPLLCMKLGSGSCGDAPPTFENRGHFFSAAAEANAPYSRREGPPQTPRAAWWRA
jgi:hypothetical protein